MIGSRGSKLALWQANWVKDRLTAAGHAVEIQVIQTTGDKLAHVPLTSSGTKGLFIKEIEEALISETVDLAVHSLKDLPTEQPAGLVIAAVPPREDARDVLISRSSTRLAELPPGSRVATSSLRRQAQLRNLRGGLELVPVRGNVDTRLRKLASGQYDAIVLAAAGIRRLGFADHITECLGFEQMCPAVGQGALAIEIREPDQQLREILAPLDDRTTHLAVRAERAMLRRLGGGCQVPIAAHAEPRGDELRLLGVVASLDGRSLVRAQAQGSIHDPEDLGSRVGEALLQQGAENILESIAR